MQSLDPEHFPAHFVDGEKCGPRDEVGADSMESLWSAFARWLEPHESKPLSFGTSFDPGEMQ
jgi:hypothetical protein